MKRNIHVALVALAAASAIFAAPLSAAAQPWAAPLPASDAVLVADMRRLLTEAVPRVFDNDAKRVADVNADIEQFRQRTGIDARQFDTVAVGARMTHPREGVTKVDHMVAVARGKFDAAAVVAAGRAAAGGRLAEQKDAGN